MVLGSWVKEYFALFGSFGGAGSKKTRYAGNKCLSINLPTMEKPL